jgi:tetratricopeptide (TPR) repeat protein
MAVKFALIQGFYLHLDAIFKNLYIFAPRYCVMQRLVPLRVNHQVFIPFSNNTNLSHNLNFQLSMNLRTGISLCCFLLATILLPAQQTTVFTEANLSYKRGVDFFEQGIYGLAQKEFYSAIHTLRPVNEPEWRDLKTNAELYYARCAVRLDQPDAEKVALDFLRDQSPSPVASQAALEIGDYYFAKKEFDKALVYYDMAPANGPLGDELRFKMGYSYFVTKKFGQAKSIFAGLKENTRSKYYEDANYYYGCCSFYEKRYDDAQKAFQRLEKSNKYGKIVAYYVCQILFAKSQYDQLISYGEPKAKDNTVRNQSEIAMLVGQAYFEKGDFKNAQSYMEFAANNGVNFRPADFYQLGYAQYQNGFYKNAIENFEQLTKQDSMLGQNGLYHLGDCYLRVRNKGAARNAFGQASSMNFDPMVKEDALMNYAKLSWELKYDRDALSALQRFQPQSPYYNDAQALMGEIFLNTRDYDRAVSTLEGVKNRSPRLNEIYQKVCYLRGLQLYQNNQKDEARRFFNKSVEQPIDRKLVTLCSFWNGMISHESNDYKGSINQMNAFLGQAKNYSDLPDESSTYMGNYVQGYNYLKQDNHKDALTYFKACVDGIKKNLSRINSEQITQGVLGDAILRTGDCHFKRNQYSEAVGYYNEAIGRKYDGFEYAIYQKAMIKGLQKQPEDKISGMEDLVNKFPNSQFVDDALYQMGLTYISLNKSSQALAALRRVVENYRGRSPLINPALLKLGLISYNDGNNSAAINYYKQVFANNPENDEAKEALSALETIYKEMNRPDEYFAFLETVPGYKVTSAARDSVTYQTAEYQYDRGQFQPAIEGFTTYLTKYPNGREALAATFYRGDSYAALGKFPEAMKDLNAVVAKGPSRYFSKAAEKSAVISYSTLKDYGKAYEMARKWEESASTAKGKFDAQVLAMESAYRSNNSVATAEYANKVISSGSASADEIARGNFYLAKMAYDRSDYARAYPSLQKVTENTQSEIMAEAYHYMCQILYRQRQFPQAEEMISTANQASAGYDDWIARNIILLSDVYADQGDRNSALAALEGVLENYSGGNQQILTETRQKYQKLGGTPPPTDPVPQGKSAPKPKQVDILDLDGGN